MGVELAFLVLVLLVLIEVLGLLTCLLLLTVCSAGVCSIPILAKGIEIVVWGVLLVMVAAAICIILEAVLALKR